MCTVRPSRLLTHLLAVLVMLTGCGDSEPNDAPSPCGPEDPYGVCPDDQTCHRGHCRADSLFCSSERPSGLCQRESDACLDGHCVDVADVCGAHNQTGLCPTGLQCNEGVCATGAPCGPTEPRGYCDAGEECVGGVCVPMDDSCSPRNPGGLCPAGEVCDSGVCVADPHEPEECSPSSPDGLCPEGEVCEDGQCVVLAADLAVTDLRVVTSGTTATYFADVENIGNAAAQGFHVDFFVHADRRPHLGDGPGDQRVWLSGLSTGSHATVEAAVSDLEPGGYGAWAFADIDGLVDDADLTNNGFGPVEYTVDGNGENGNGPHPDPDGCAPEDAPTGFDALPDSYLLPASRCAVAFDAPAKSRPSQDLTYNLLDLTGNGRLDLVVFSDACDAAIGRDHWHVYPGGETGFAPVPITIGLPAALCSTPFDAPAKGPQGSLTYALIDLAAGGTPSLVVSADACDDAVGRDHWLVYSLSGNAFEASPAFWSIPAGRCGVAFDRFARSRSTGALAFGLVDLDGDGLPALVVHGDDCDEATGSSRWHVYEQSSNGFVAAPSSWAIPAGRCGLSFDEAARTTSNLGFGLHRLLDEAAMSLIVFDDSCDEPVGASRWDRYTAGSGGFAPMPAAVDVPAGRCGVSFDRPARTGSLGYETVSFACSGTSGILVTRDDCSAPVGTDRWDLYRLEPSGFEAVPRPVDLPAPRCGRAFDRTSAAGAPVTYSLLHLCSTGLPSLVVFRDDCDSNIGSSHWHVYLLE